MAGLFACWTVGSCGSGPGDWALAGTFYCAAQAREGWTAQEGGPGGPITQREGPCSPVPSLLLPHVS